MDLNTLLKNPMKFVKDINTLKETVNVLDVENLQMESTMPSDKLKLLNEIMPNFQMTRENYANELDVMLGLSGANKTRRDLENLTGKFIYLLSKHMWCLYLTDKLSYDTLKTFYMNLFGIDLDKVENKAAILSKSLSACGYGYSGYACYGYAGYGYPGYGYPGYGYPGYGYPGYGYGYGLFSQHKTILNYTNPNLSKFDIKRWGGVFDKVKDVIDTNKWDKITYADASSVSNKTLKYALETVGNIHSVKLNKRQPAEFTLHMNEDFKNKYGNYFDNCRVYEDNGDFTFLFWIEEITFLFNYISLNSDIDQTIFINIHDHPIDNGKLIRTIDDHPYPDMKKHSSTLKINVTTQPEPNFPIYCWPAKKTHKDIGLPFHDIWMFIFKYWFSNDFNIDTFNKNPGVNKLLKDKIPKGFFRGSYTNCAYPIKNSVRLLSHLKTLQDEAANGLNSLVDAYVVGGPATFSYQHYQTSYLENNSLDYWLKPDKFTPAKDQPNYRYILNLDGFASAFRIIQEIYYNSILIIPDSDYTDVIRENLEPWKHYVPVKGDLSNLRNTIEWCNNNLDKMEIILKNLQNLRDNIIRFEHFIELTKRRITEKSGTIKLTDIAGFNTSTQIKITPPTIPDDAIQPLGKTTEFVWKKKSDNSEISRESVSYKKYLKYKEKYLKLKSELEK